ncbi:hypothetical protein CYMTET_48716, partial [Cymbomonas tetramitiformis]
DSKLRPAAKDLQNHVWLQDTKRTLKDSWPKSGGRIKKNYENVATVVERMIEQHGDASEPGQSDLAASGTEDVPERPAIGNNEATAAVPAEATSDATVSASEHTRIGKEPLQADRAVRSEERSSGILDTRKAGLGPLSMSLSETEENVDMNLAEWLRLQSAKWQQPHEEAQQEGRSRPEASGRQDGRPDLGEPTRASPQDDAPVLGRDDHSTEFNKQFSTLRAGQPEETILGACRWLTSHIASVYTSAGPGVPVSLIGQHCSWAPLVEMLSSASPGVACATLQLVCKMNSCSETFLTHFCMLGALPPVMRFVRPEVPLDTRLAAAHLLDRVCRAGHPALGMMLASQGTAALSDMFKAERSRAMDPPTRTLLRLAIDCVSRVLEGNLPHLTYDLCQMLASCGLLDHMVPCMPALVEDCRTAAGIVKGVAPPSGQIAHLTEDGGLGVAVLVGGSSADSRSHEYLEKVTNLLLVFCAASPAVKLHMCHAPLLHVLLSMLSEVETGIAKRVVACLWHLSKDPLALEPLETAGAIQRLVPLLGAEDMDLQRGALAALYHLCKIRRHCQEQAAVAGIVPFLCAMVAGADQDKEKPVANEKALLRQLATPMLCAMVNATTRVRAELWRHRALDLYLDLFASEQWQVTALEAVTVWLSQEQGRVEPRLLDHPAQQLLLTLFSDSTSESFVHLLDPLLKMLTKSRRINTALSMCGLVPVLIKRLRSAVDSHARLMLIKIMQLVYEHHPRPKQLIAQHDLAGVLRSLLEQDQGGSMVLVSQMASSLLKSLDINMLI